MQLRKHQVATAQGATGAAPRPEQEGKLGHQKIGIPGEPFGWATDPDNQAEKIDKPTRRTALTASVDGKRAGHVTRAIVCCDHSDAGAFSQILACRESGGIEGYLVSLIVSRIDQNQ